MNNWIEFSMRSMKKLLEQIELIIKKLLKPDPAPVPVRVRNTPNREKF